MRVGGDADRDQAVFEAVDDFLLVGTLGRAADEASTGSHVDKHDWIVLGMDILFHGNLVASTFPTRREGGEWRETARCQAAMKEFFGFLGGLKWSEDRDILAFQS